MKKLSANVTESLGAQCWRTCTTKKWGVSDMTRPTVVTHSLQVILFPFDRFKSCLLPWRSLQLYPYLSGVNEIRTDPWQQCATNYTKSCCEVYFLVSTLFLTEGCCCDTGIFKELSCLLAELQTSVMNGIICTTHQYRKNSTNNARKFSSCRCFPVSSWKWICSLINLALVKNKTKQRKN